MTEEQVIQEYCHRVKIHAPHLDDNLQPKFELQIGEICPKGQNGKCSSCKSFLGFQNPDGYVFSYMTFEGYCIKDENKIKEFINKIQSFEGG